MSTQENGVAPEVVATGDGDYSIPEGYTCIGFYVGSGGNVTFTSKGADITVSCTAHQAFSGHITAFKASGTTAGDILAYLIK